MSSQGTTDGRDPPREVGAVDQDLVRLRRLLLGLEQDQIRAILERLDNPEQYAAEIGEALPAAILHAVQSGPKLERALAPALEKATGRAIRRDTRAFAGALFPVMGPAIRRSIAEALAGLVQSINQALQHSLSLRGLRWRLEAARTGRTFAEVVLANTLIYRVEQVLLIHRENGLLIAEAVAPEVRARDTDAVSGMLTAIQDFVRDSFQVEQDDSLQTMEVGDLQVWVEQGPRAVLAAVVRGNAPLELRKTLREALEALHLAFGEDLAHYDGDSDTFVAAVVPLEECLEVQRVEPPRRISAITWVALAVLALVVVTWAWTGWRSRERMERFLGALRAEPGIVVTEVDRRGRGLAIAALCDPLARPPEDIAEELGIDPGSVRFHLQPYHATEDDILLTRARQSLQPPDSVELAVESGALTLSGRAGRSWVEQARRAAAFLPGLSAYDDHAMEVEDHAAEARRRMASLTEHVESHVVTFDSGSAEIDGAEARALEQLAQRMIELIEIGQKTFQVVHVRVEGHADPSGTPEFNVTLSRDRAMAALSFLTQRGVPEKLLLPEGRGALLGSIAEEGDHRMLRKVSFVVEVTSLADSPGEQR